MRAVTREPDSVDRVLEEIDAAGGSDSWFDRGVRELRTELRGREERRARRLAEMLALCLQGSLLLRNGSPMADAFCTTRIGGDHGLAYGTLPRDFDLGVLMARAWAPD